VLIGFRVLQAAGGAMLVLASQGLVLEAFPIEQRRAAMSLWVAAGAVAAALVPPLGGVIVEIADWRWVFLINLPIAAAVASAGSRCLIESRDEGTTGLPDPVGIGLSAAAVGLVVLAIVQGDAWGWAGPGVLSVLAGSVLFGALFVRRTRRAAVPALDLDLFRSRDFSLANAASLLIGIAFYGQLVAAVPFLTTVWGYRPIEAGLALAPAPGSPCPF
jgi:MFS family permease